MSNDQFVWLTTHHFEVGVAGLAFFGLLLVFSLRPGGRR